MLYISESDEDEDNDNNCNFLGDIYEDLFENLNFFQCFICF